MKTITQCCCCLFIGSFLLLVISDATFGQSDNNYDGDDGYEDGGYDNGYDGYDDYGGYNDCTFYHDEHSANGECHHEVFPNKTLVQLFNANVKQCCGVHAYMFYDNCEVSIRTHDVARCRYKYSSRKGLLIRSELASYRLISQCVV